MVELAQNCLCPAVAYCNTSPVTAPALPTTKTGVAFLRTDSKLLPAAALSMMAAGVAVVAAVGKETARPLIVAP
jgi:hypothetical protein